MVPHPRSQLDEDKRALRRAMVERREQLAPAEREARSREVCRRVLALPAVQARLAEPAGRTISGYVATRGELDVAPALAEARALGATIALPRVTGARRLEFHVWHDAADLAPGKYGILEPSASCPEVPVGAIDVVVVPGLAFDGHGHRVGYGGGFYDQVAVRVRAAGRGVLVGVGFDFQLIDRCPAGDGDEALDFIVTEERVVTRSGAGAAGGAAQ